MLNNILVCTCGSGLTGNPEIECVLLECQYDAQCPTNKACLNYKCENPCEKTVVCGRNEICSVFNHRSGT